MLRCAAVVTALIVVEVCRCSLVQCWGITELGLRGVWLTSLGVTPGLQLLLLPWDAVQSRPGEGVVTCHTG